MEILYLLKILKVLIHRKYWHRDRSLWVSYSPIVQIMLFGHKNWKIENGVVCQNWEFLLEIPNSNSKSVQAKRNFVPGLNFLVKPLFFAKHVPLLIWNPLRLHPHENVVLVNEAWLHWCTTSGQNCNFRLPEVIFDLTKSEVVRAYSYLPFCHFPIFSSI